MSRRKLGVLTSVVAMLLMAATVRAEQDSVAAARDLYSVGRIRRRTGGVEPVARVGPTG